MRSAHAPGDAAREKDYLSNSMTPRHETPASPYRASPARGDSTTRARLRVPTDVMVLVAGAAAVALLRHWPEAVDAFATVVLGFPSLRG